MEQINFFNSDIDKEIFENSINKKYYTELTDNTKIELIKGGYEKKVNFEDRFDYLKMVLKARLTESDSQISAIKKGLCKVVPYSLLKCKKIYKLFIIHISIKFNSIKFKLIF
jgi:E3 ubiquitin-protein ligase HECTD3